VSSSAVCAHVQVSEISCLLSGKFMSMHVMKKTTINFLISHLFYVVIEFCSVFEEVMGNNQKLKQSTIYQHHYTYVML